jgi:radical SAM superfamily enzyme YgiQ (UPF0313 family)
MKVKMILPALTEAKSPYWRPIKYHLFPPLGLATLAGYLSPDDEVGIQDEHVEEINTSDRPDLVVIQVYITNARRAYELADTYRQKGCFVCLGGLHVTSLPEEALTHADVIFLGPGEDTWPQFLLDFQRKETQRIYQSKTRTLCNLPKIRRDLFKRHHYLVPNSLVISRGCPHHCDFCYKDAFFKGGRSFYTQPVEDVLCEIDSLSGKHLYFLDDHLFAKPDFITQVFAGMQGMQRVWQAAGTVASILQPGLMEQAAASGLRSLFIGFESVDNRNISSCNKMHNLNQDNLLAIRNLRDLGVMINASFVFGMDHDDPSVFARTVDWALENGIQTATFHILTPYPGTALHQKLSAERRITDLDWNHYDTRHAVFQPMQMSARQLEDGYWQAYRDFYRFSSIWQSAGIQGNTLDSLRHLAYVCGWKKMEPLWDWMIRMGALPILLPVLETVLSGRNAQSTLDINPAIRMNHELIEPLDF